MVISKNKFIYFLICAVIMFLPRRWLIAGIQSYRLIIVFLLFIQGKKIGISKLFFNLFTVIYIFYTSIYYLIDGSIFSCIGFIIDTAGLFTVIYSAISTEEDFKLFFKIFIRCIILYSILCIIQTFTEFNIFDIIAGCKPSVALTSVYYRFGFVRSYGSFTTSINNALFLVMASYLILYQISVESDVKIKKKYLRGYLIVVLAILSTISRVPLFLYFISIIFYFIKKGLFNIIFKNLRKVIIVAIIIMTIFVGVPQIRNITTNFINMFVAVFDDSTSERISKDFGVNVDGIGQRLLLFQWVEDTIENNKLLGVGPSKEVIFYYKDEWNKTRVKTSIENNYLKTLCYFGYIGLLVYLIFTINMIWFNIKRLKKRKLDFYYIVFIIQVVYIIGIFNATSVDDMRMYFMVLAMMYINYCKLNNNLNMKGNVKNELVRKGYHYTFITSKNN